MSGTESIFVAVSESGAFVSTGSFIYSGGEDYFKSSYSFGFSI